MFRVRDKNKSKISVFDTAIFSIFRGSLKKKKRDSTNDENEEKSDTPKKHDKHEKPATVPRKTVTKDFEESDTPHTRKKSYKKRESKNSKEKNHKNKNHDYHAQFATNLRKTELTSSDPDLTSFRSDIDLSAVDEIQSNLLQFHLAQTDDNWPF